MASKSGQRLDLHDALSRGSFDHAVICTFAFDPRFFEEYCLEKFGSLNTNGNISVIVDRGIYERILVAPESQRPTKANLRYLLHPASVRGAFHPKLYLLARRNKARLIIGSANLTRSGITSNAEMGASFDYEEGKNEVFKPLFQSAFGYLSEIGRRFRTEALDSNLSAVARDVPWLTSEVEPNNEYPTFLHNLVEPLWDQILRELKPPVDALYILSRYFDSNPRILDTIEQTLSPHRIKIFTQNGITSLTPEWLKHRLVKKKRAEIFLCRFFDADHAQPLHAKALIVEKGDKCLLVFGSANFSSAALLKTADNGNAETVLMLRDIPSKTLRPLRLLDPEGTAILLKDEGMLQSAKQDEDDWAPSPHDIQLYEASLDGNMISITADVPESLDRNALIATLTFQRFAKRSLPVSRQGNNTFSARIAEIEKQRLDTESTIIQLEAFNGSESIASSNSLFVTNLKDFKTDKPLRRERHIREAEQSAAQFFSVLRDLISAGDNEALLLFLNFCDIPLSGAAMPWLIRRMKPVWDGGVGMRSLGARNLTIYANLHEAAINFFDRHFRKLRRHAKSRTLDGVANFLHVFLAMAGILQSQVERAVIGLESKATSVTTEEWGDCRKHWDVYFGRFKQLMDCLWGEYVSPMLREYGVNKIKQEFGPDLEPIHQLCVDMICYRDRIEAFRTTKMKRFVSPGREIVPGYFHCVLGAETWPRYSQHLVAELEDLEKALGYAA